MNGLQWRNEFKKCGLQELTNLRDSLRELRTNRVIYQEFKGTGLWIIQAMIQVEINFKLIKEGN